ncbi:DUF305 domain-containing protein [uncultured Pseudokineococcus sp.]|uniref:DUF305 domain-containing protein n=1 Tax=uncultured Pseudokineococcus sp. TaxID=1642928 RepID=UPI00261B4097|nr:DUF305 domain-containing protein [uncultured Pseudokineococcus sp.]
MKTRPMRKTLPALALSATLALAGCGVGQNGGMGGGAGMSPEAGPAASSSSSSSSQAQHNQADVMFLQMMYPHHAQARQMSQLVQGRTQNPDVLDLADQIEQAQQAEMDQMSALLESFGEPAPSADSMQGMDHGGGHGMGGMMSEQDMAALEQASGTEFDRMWLSMMVEHHAGAIDMARMEVEGGANEEVRQLAADMADAQEAEITTMEDLLAQM